ncbi:citrinin biosynthesis oxidoreductase CtnB [Didymella exigua CBS 183.55]|uniref:Citrinin biosynthesis oxidoreductase CtnB n=1 Tax=Didymella exigua CBS 183.55 TaxID=1150837 RepID=A0A6A5RWZ0_9PLEO|nr:citrinin biosynthesis oxidoreductase CtnB [Didymella exigua CBS 183.55]KAF1932093.1 citrinin biosynthesis oxidoreductase CtnB [Didymella exigua CBS 183.55]
MPSKDPPVVSRIHATKPDTKALPRILCLHGGGVNAAIFEAQSRSLIRHLQHSFRLVWADAPFFCDPHADVIDVYGSYAPFRRWLRWLPEHPEIDAESCIEEMGYAIRTTMEDDDRAGATGEWVGLMGFSQGAKLSASILLEQQAREEKARREGRSIDVGLIKIPGLHWRFGILLAGRAPLSNLNPDVLTSPALVGAGDLSEGFQFCKEVKDDTVLRMPALHVHGMADAGLHLHRKLLHEYCSKDAATLVEWEGAHRIPLKSKDVDRVVGAIYDIAEKTGVEVTRTV